MYSPPLWTNHTKLYRARGRSNFTLAPPAGLRENYEVERVKVFSSLGGLAAQGGLQNNRSNQLLDGAWSGSTVPMSQSAIIALRSGHRGSVRISTLTASITKNTSFVHCCLSGNEESREEWQAWVILWAGNLTEENRGFLMRYYRTLWSNG